MYDVDQCSRSSSCTDCLSTGDALCGWCTLRNVCVSRTSCLPVLDRDSEERSVFAEGSTSQCPSLTRATPSVIHLEQLNVRIIDNVGGWVGGSSGFSLLFSME